MNAINTDEPVGLLSGTVSLAPYHPRWAELFAAEAAKIETAVRSVGVSLAVEHMGSTAVPGLSAKPIIDILVGWYHAKDRPVLIELLVATGYEHRGENGIAGREFFRRGAPRSYHVHLVARDDTSWQNHLAFRDLLRADLATANAYGTLKRELAARYPYDRPAYIEGKTAFVEVSLARARVLGMYHDREA